MSNWVIDSPRGDDWRITIDGKVRGHYRDDNVLAEHLVLVIQENDALRAELAALREAAEVMEKLSEVSDE